MFYFKITETAKLQVKQIYNQTLKQPIDRLNNIKDITTNKVGGNKKKRSKFL